MVDLVRFSWNNSTQSATIINQKPILCVHEMHLLQTHFINITMNGNDLHIRFTQTTGNTCRGKKKRCTDFISIILCVASFGCVSPVSSPIFKSIELNCFVFVSQTANSKQKTTICGRKKEGETTSRDDFIQCASLSLFLTLFRPLCKCVSVVCMLLLLHVPEVRAPNIECGDRQKLQMKSQQTNIASQNAIVSVLGRIYNDNSDLNIICS